MNRPHIPALILLLAMFLSPSVAWAQTYFINWTKFDNNTPAPSDGSSTNGKVPLGSNGRGDDAHTHTPFVLKDGSIYKKWYGGSDGATFRIYYATSSNGLEWTKLDNGVPANSDGSSTNGKIPLGTPGKGDSDDLYDPFVLKDGSIYKMWYGARDDISSNWRIYYATSSNGLEWTKLDNGIPAPSDTSCTNGKIPLGTAGKGDEVHAYNPSVLKDDVPPIYKMWYTGVGGGIYRIYYATSSNGLEWIKYSNAVPPGTSDTTNWGSGRIPLGSNTRGDDTYAYNPFVLKDGSTYKMWYGGHDGGTNRLYYATSPDGLVWTKYDNTIPPASDTTNSNGRLGLGTTGKGDVRLLDAPCVMKDDSTSTYKMWYMGYDGANFRIYHATFEIPPPAGTIFTFK